MIEVKEYQANGIERKLIELTRKKIGKQTLLILPLVLAARLKSDCKK